MSNEIVAAVIFLCNTTIFVAPEGARKHEGHASHLRTCSDRIHRAGAIVVERCGIVVSILDVGPERF
jgi:hypothetical protein